MTSESKVFGNHSGDVDSFEISAARLECDCGWSGACSGAGIEWFDELYEVNCPLCDTRFATVMSATYDRVFEAALEGYPDAVAAAERLRSQGIYPQP